LGIGDWGLGIGDWGLGPIPNPHPLNIQFNKYINIKFYIKNKINKINYFKYI